MASAPFTPNEALPGDSDIVSTFPGVERTFRDIIESWILVEHDTYGHHKIPRLTTSQRDADTNWSAGALIYNTTLKALQVATAADPEVWAFGGFETGVRMLFQQTAVPLGWTKESDSAYDDVAIRMVTGTVGGGGTTVFSAQFDLDVTGGHALTLAENGPHGHGYNINAGSDGNDILTTGNFIARRDATGTNYGRASSDSVNTVMVASSGSGTPHTHPLDLRVKYKDVVIGIKD